VSSSSDSIRVLFLLRTITAIHIIVSSLIEVTEMTKGQARDYIEQANRDGHPCKYGHFGCAVRDGGPCSDELAGRFQIDDDDNEVSR
jgi:hypothetical protein